ncbi:MAG: hypothetical protein WC584_03920 [Candidatus Pacearchaeota archaeon]
MGNKLTRILYGLMLVGVTSPLWIKDVFTDTRRVKLESGKEVVVSRWNDGSKTEMYTGSVSGNCLTDFNQDGNVDSKNYFITAPRQYPMRFDSEVTSEEDQKLYGEALAKFENSEPIGIKGIYNSFVEMFGR